MKPAVRVCLRLLAVRAVVTRNAHVNADAALLIVVVRLMPSDYESASSDGDRKQPPSDESGEYQGQRSHVHDRTLHQRLDQLRTQPQ